MKAMVHKVDGKCKQGQPRIKWREQVEGSMRKISLRKDAADQCRWREGVTITEIMGCIWPPQFTADI